MRSYILTCSKLGRESKTKPKKKKKKKVSLGFSTHGHLLKLLLMQYPTAGHSLCTDFSFYGEGDGRQPTRQSSRGTPACPSSAAVSVPANHLVTGKREERGPGDTMEDTEAASPSKHWRGRVTAAHRPGGSAVARLAGPGCMTRLQRCSG